MALRKKHNFHKDFIFRYSPVNIYLERLKFKFPQRTMAQHLNLTEKWKTILAKEKVQKLEKESFRMKYEYDAVNQRAFRNAVKNEDWLALKVFCFKESSFFFQKIEKFSCS